MPCRPTWAAVTTATVQLILAEIQADHGQTAVDALIREFDFETLFGFKPGTVFRQPV